jgi:hypothetical protein
MAAPGESIEKLHDRPQAASESSATAKRTAQEPSGAKLAPEILTQCSHDLSAETVLSNFDNLGVSLFADCINAKTRCRALASGWHYLN